MKPFSSLSAIVVSAGILLMVMDWLTLDEALAMTAAGIAAVAFGGLLSVAAFIRHEHSVLKYCAMAISLSTFAVIAFVEPQPLMHLAAWFKRLL